MNWRKIFSRACITPIGVDLGARMIKAVQASRCESTGQAEITAAATLRRTDAEAPFGPADVARLAQVLERRGFRGRRIILAAPAGKLESDLLELPARSSGAPVDELAALEIGRVSKLDPSSYETTCWDVPAPRVNTAVGTCVLAIALRHTDAEDLAAPFDAHGFTVRAIDAPALALSRALVSLKADGSLVALLDLGWSAGSICVLSGGQVLYQRLLQGCGLGPLYRQLADRHAIGEDAADYLLCDDQASVAVAKPAVGSVVEAYAAQIADELGASLAFIRHRFAGSPMTGVRLIGGGAKVRGLADLLAGALRIPVAVEETPASVGMRADLEGGAAWAQLALAAGLAFHPEAA